jgi:hypothetical protein
MSQALVPMTRLLPIAATSLALLVHPATGSGARFAIGLVRGADAGAVAEAIAKRTGSLPMSLRPLPALAVRAPRGASLAGIAGVRYVDPLRPRRLLYTPNDPFLSRQWYLAASHFYESWLTLPAFAPVPVAVIDSGVDATQPELAGKILAAKSFVGGSASVDTLGHGTFIAGMIAANIDDGVGIAGLAPSAQLLVAKVVNSQHEVPVLAESRAVYWAVDQGARVINLSLGGLRDPLDPTLDTYSPLEADAIRYAVANGVVVVAAVGNDDNAPARPWPYASYPAALPHVLGVSSYGESGNISSFSNRDPVYNDLAAPGENIFSILPRNVTARFPTCSEQGFSSCGPPEYRSAEGTSYAAAQVSAAAAVLLSLRPTLRPEQVTTILERTAVDLTPADGCAACAPGRDRLSGWGKLDVAAAIAALASPPPRDHYEPNDDAGQDAFFVSGRARRLNATLDYWDDQDDVYGITLRKGQRVYLRLQGGDPQIDLGLALWLPGTRTVNDLRQTRLRVRESSRPGARQAVAYRASLAGEYFVQIRIEQPGATGYSLLILKR